MTHDMTTMRDEDEIGINFERASERRSTHKNRKISEKQISTFIFHPIRRGARESTNNLIVLFPLFCRCRVRAFVSQLSCGVSLKLKEKGSKETTRGKSFAIKTTQQWDRIFAHTVRVGESIVICFDIWMRKQAHKTQLERASERYKKNCKRKRNSPSSLRHEFWFSHHHWASCLMTR